MAAPGELTRAAYRGRIAPTPTGDLHVGHARTFVAAWRRAEAAGGALVLRVEAAGGAAGASRATAFDAPDPAHAPHEDEEEREPVFPPSLRPPPGPGRDAESPAGVVWRLAKRHGALAVRALRASPRWTRPACRTLVSSASNASAFTRTVWRPAPECQAAERLG